MTTKLTRRRLMQASAAVAVAGGAGPFFGTSALAQARPKVRIATLKQASLTNVWVAKQQGMFDKHGLDAEIIDFRSGNEAISAQRGGHVDIVLSIPGSAMAAIERGFDLVMICQNETSKATPPDSGSLQVLADSPIKSVKDLAGKKIALSNLRSQKHVAVMQVLKNNGVDPKSVQFIELPYNNHPDVLKAKQIDVSASLDPWTTQMRTSGLTRVIAWDYVESVPEQPIGIWLAREVYIKANRDTVLRFNAAIRDSIEFMQADAERARKMVSDYTGLKFDLMKDMPINNWTYRIKRDRWQATIDMMHEHGGLTKPHKAEEYFSDLVQEYIIK